MRATRSKPMTNEERARKWLGSRCTAQAKGEVRFQVDMEDDTDSGKPCNCVKTLTALLDDAEKRGASK